MDADGARFRVLSPGLVAAAAVGLAAVLGGAFYPAPRLLVGVLLAAALGWGIARLPRPLEDHELLLAAFVLWGAVVAVVRPTAPLRSKVALTAWLVAWGLWVLARRLSAAERRRAMTVLVAAACVVVLGIVFEYSGFGVPRVGGVLENPNVAVALLVPAMPAAVLLTGARLTVTSGAIMAWIGLGVVFTGSRAGLLAAAAAMVVMLPRGRVRMLAVVFSVVAVAGLVWWRFRVHPDPLAWHRLEIWKALWRLLANQPLTGVSPGAVADAAGPVRICHPELIGHYQRVIGHCESTPLGLLVQTGVVGFGIAVAALVAWVRREWRQRLFSCRATTALVAAVVVLAAVHDQLDVDVVLWWWALLVGAASARLDSTETPPRTGWARPVAGLALVTLVAWGMLQPAMARWMWRSRSPQSADVVRAMSAEPWFSEPARFRAAHLLLQPEWSWEEAAEALMWSRRAVDASPGRARVWATLARVHARVIVDLGVWPDGVTRVRWASVRACELEPQLPWFRVERAQLERSLGQLDLARSLVLEALAAEPHYVRGRLLLARIELDLGRLGAARAAVEAALASRALGERRILTRYERELLALPAAQLKELQEVLQ
jgi:O-antigen ligase